MTAAIHPGASRPAGQKQPPHGKLHAAAVLILLNLQEKLLHVLDSVLEAVLFLQLLDGRLAVLDEGGSVDGSAVVGLLVVLNDLLQLCPASLAFAWSTLSGKLMMNSR